MVDRLPILNRLPIEEKHQIVLNLYAGNDNNKRMAENCQQCGACCVVFEIKELGKKRGEICPHLIIGEDRVACGIYLDPIRPWVCKAYDCRGEQYRNGSYSCNWRVVELNAAQRYIASLQKRVFG